MAGIVLSSHWATVPIAGHGTVVVGKVPAGRGGTVTVNLPPGLQSVPFVVITPWTTSRVVWVVTGATNKSFTLRYDNFTSASAAGAGVQWIAFRV